MAGKTPSSEAFRIRDGLIANNKGNKARVRIANEVATIALKSRRSGLARTEFEYAIPYADAEEMLRVMCDGNVLDKVRHFVLHSGKTWQVDVYEGLLDGVELAEIELTEADQKLTLPDWIGAEVTVDPRYRKINMDRINELMRGWRSRKSTATGKAAREAVSS